LFAILHEKRPKNYVIDHPESKTMHSVEQGKLSQPVKGMHSKDIHTVGALGKCRKPTVHSLGKEKNGTFSYNLGFENYSIWDLYIIDEKKES